MIYDSIIDTVGRTPLVRLNRMVKPGRTVLVKCESFNPCSCVKERIGVSMIEAAEKEGHIKPDTVIIEPTSGNTGIGLAFVCAAKGYKLKLVMPESMSIERRKMLKLLGAELVLTPAAGGMKGAVEEAERLVKETPDAFMPQQFNNPANPEVHRRTTAEEIWSDTDGKFDIFVAGIGTGGTITGCAEVFKNRKADIHVIGVEPESSAVLSSKEPGPHKIQGIGAGFVPKVLNTDIYDEVFMVTNEQAMETARKLASQEGILGGISCGAALYAALEAAHRPENDGKTTVCILPDTAERYISTELFNL